MLKQNFYHLPTSEVLSILNSDLSGLTETEARRRFDSGPRNVLPEPKRDGVFLIFIRQFKSPLIYTLCLASFLVMLMGDWSDGVVIGVVLLVNAIVGSIQEGRAEASLLALRKLNSGTAKVLRAGKTLAIPEEEVVPGDILILNEGDLVSADARVLQVSGLSVNESSLTGESVSVAKQSDVLADNLPISDLNNMVFKGTFVASGSGMAVACVVGTDTQMGAISDALARIHHEIPLQVQIRKLSQGLIVVVLGLASLLFLVGFSTGLPPVEIFSASIALAISMIPAGLPVAVTVILAAGVWRMSKRKALVRKLQAVEALAHIEVLAVDKTGTITQNELTVSRLWVNGETFHFTGRGFDPAGKILLKNQPVSLTSGGELGFLAQVASLASEAQIALDEETSAWRVVSGDPTDAAVLVMAKKMGVEKNDLLSKMELLEKVPFDYKKKFHASVYRAGKFLIYSAMGAPESILDLCDTDAVFRRKVLSVSQKMAKEGLRVIALAGIKTMESNRQTPIKFLGLTGMSDLLYESVPDTVRILADSGIRTVMITGDTPHTGKAIAETAGIFHPSDEVLTGADLAKLSYLELLAVLPKTSVFARIEPKDKMKIVEGFGRLRQGVAMTGDGVNDAPALLAADLGIAMGGRGTEVAKAAADIVLVDDNFSTIASAVEEGRGTFATIQRVLTYLFSTSIGELCAVFLGVILGLGLLLTGGQIVWLNFVTDGLLTVALGLEPAGKLSEKPRIFSRHLFLLGKREVSRILWLGLVMGLLSVFIYKNAMHGGAMYAQTLTLTFLAVVQWLNAWNIRAGKSIFLANPLRNPWLILATSATVLLQILAVHWSVLQKVLGTQNLAPQDWLFAIVLGFSIILADELWKLVFGKK